MIVYVFSFVDRQILSLLVDPIKADLGLSDTQISYLGGFTFALFYTLFGIPIARWADSKNRTVLITVGLAVWSFFTMLCGTASRFWTFAFYRMGVGVGEATLSPSAYSIITDMFRPERLAVAISLYSAGIYIGSGLAQVFGGIVIGFAVSTTELTIPFVALWHLAVCLLRGRLSWSALHAGFTDRQRTGQAQSQQIRSAK